MLTHFNDKTSRQNWHRELLDNNTCSLFEHPSIWPEKEPLTRVHAFCLHTNHLHFLLEEIAEGGISAFMKKIGNGIAGYINERHGEYGSPFQGAYKSKTIDNDTYLRYVFAYIQVKNVFEQFPGGYTVAENNFDAAYEWTIQFPYGSLFDHLSRSDLDSRRNIVEPSLFNGLWTPAEFKIYARDVINGRSHLGTTDKNAFRGAFL